MGIPIRDSFAENRGVRSSSDRVCTRTFTNARIMNMSNEKCCCLLFVVLTCLAAAGSNSEHNEDLLARKVGDLTRKSAEENVIRLTIDMYTRYFRKQPRNYSVVLMLTALKRQCEICKIAYEEFEILANSWRYSQQNPTALFFALADADVAPAIFHKLGINHIPVYVYIPPKGKPQTADRPQTQRNMAEELADWIKTKTGFQIHVYRPIAWSYWACVVGVVAVVGVLLYLLWNKLYLVFHWTVGAVGILVFIFAMISGHMWNKIREARRMYTNPNTGEKYHVHPSSSQQFIVETYIIMSLYGCVVVGIIMMNEVGSLKNCWGKILLALAGLSCFVAAFCALLNVFTIKYSYYPYGFFPLLEAYVLRWFK